mgnify:CR=1 FL=1|jgi:hypothetical protein
MKKYDRPKGHRYRPVVTVLKIKKDVPTVIRVSGREYVLRTPDQFNQRKKGAVGR